MRVSFTSINSFDDGEGELYADAIPYRCNFEALMTEYPARVETISTAHKFTFKGSSKYPERAIANMSSISSASFLHIYLPSY